MSPVVRTVLFWVMMIALAVVLWGMASKPAPEKPALPRMSYSEFMSHVDKNNVASAKLIESTATAEIQAQLRDSSLKFAVTIPREVIPDLTEKLRKQGAAVDVSEVASPGTESRAQMLITIFPILLIVAIWIFVMRLKMKKQNPPQQGGPASGALG